MKKYIGLLGLLYCLPLLAQEHPDTYIKNRWMFSLWADYYPAWESVTEQHGYAPISLLPNGGYSMQLAYQRNWTPWFFNELKIKYSRFWTILKESKPYDLALFNYQPIDSLVSVSNFEQKYERELLALSLGAGGRHSLHKAWALYYSAALKLAYFSKGYEEKRTEYIGIRQGTNQTLLPRLERETLLPGAKIKHWNNQTYILPMLELEGVLAFSPQKWENRALQLHVGFSCACFGQEGAGIFRFTYYDRLYQPIGHKFSIHRLWNWSIGIGLSF